MGTGYAPAQRLKDAGRELKAGPVRIMDGAGRLLEEVPPSEFMRRHAVGRNRLVKNRARWHAVREADANKT